ncbi:MAG TPA: hypothetical protein VKB38_12775 [Terracidiphilus sp.]|nr:hypothetical protein [Terracidiphilus sp.]
MRSWRLVLLLAALFLVPFGMKANAQVTVGVGIGPVVAGPVAYGPPVCSWGYYPYYPYSCAPYGYYGPSWFVGGVFIGAGPWYGWGWHGGYHGYYGGYHGHYVNHYGGYGYRGGYGHGGYPPAHPASGFRGGNGAGFHGGGFGGGHSVGFAGGGGGFHGGGGGGFHGGGGHR